MRASEWPCVSTVNAVPTACCWLASEGKLLAAWPPLGPLSRACRAKVTADCCLTHRCWPSSSFRVSFRLADDGKLVVVVLAGRFKRSSDCTTSHHSPSFDSLCSRGSGRFLKCSNLPIERIDGQVGLVGGASSDCIIHSQLMTHT